MAHRREATKTTLSPKAARDDEFGREHEPDCRIVGVGSTPMTMISWSPQTDVGDEVRGQRLNELELEVCTRPELLGMGHHLFCMATEL